jgi:hypothetical protein
MSAISDMIQNSMRKKQSAKRYFKSLEDNQNFLDQMLVVIQKAKEQGEPDNPQARRELARRRPTTLVMPGRGTSFDRSDRPRRT